MLACIERMPVMTRAHHRMLDHVDALTKFMDDYSDCKPYLQRAALSTAIRVYWDIVRDENATYLQAAPNDMYSRLYRLCMLFSSYIIVTQLRPRDDQLYERTWEALEDMRSRFVTPVNV